MEPRELKKTKLLGLSKLKDKLLNLSPLRNRKIRFYISERLAWDLTELFAENNPKLVNDFSFSVLNSLINSSRGKEKFSLNLEPFFSPLTPEEILKFQKKIIHLQRKNSDVQQEKGYKVLFLGVIFVRGYFYNTNNILRLVNAPLFLLPCNLEKIKNLSLVVESERKVNYSLIYYLQKELGLAKEKFADFLSKLENNNQEEMTSWENYLFFLNNEFRQLFSASRVKISFSPMFLSCLGEEPEPKPELVPFSETNPITDNSTNNFSPEPFGKLTLSNKPKNYPENQLEIVGNFCLTIDDEPSLSLFHDFEKIIEEYSQDKEINWSQSALNLLRGEVESVLTYPKLKESNQPAKSLYVPLASDPSQTRILKVIFQHFSENTLCIDGPPGTGKSQLICNLLANALFYQKKVLVICEKEVALKVIYDKLSKIGLNSSLIKINELSQTTQVYQDILSHLEKNQQERTSHYDYLDNAKQIANLEEKQAVNLKKIADYCRVESEFRDNRQISLQEVYLKFDRKYQLSSALIQLNKDIQNKEKLDELKSDLENYLSKFNKIFGSWKPICLQLKNSFLENNSRGFEFNEDNRNNFQQLINSILKELEGKKTETNLLNKIWRINFFQEHSQIHKSPALLETKLKELEELRAKNNCRNFFAFLQLENFADFWQKCSDKEFLLTIHQFISEEFLTIKELHFDLTKFSENTKKNIDWFLRKILVEQELDHLNGYKENIEQSVYFNWIKEVEEENKEILTNWNQDELIRIQHEQGEITRRKNSLIKIALKNKQKENLNRLFTNQLLKKELNRKRKIAPLKKIFPLLVDYFPIWLTTPKVIAAITDLQRPSFDFLVFDEASQMPLEKAIPLWARAKKCIVIGDEQQLPPTDFFKSHLETDEEIWEEEEKLTNEPEKSLNLEIDDLEKNSNLLSYAKKYARNREKLTLLYHYRSRYPELIEFSNQAFYNGILQIVAASELRKKNYLPIEYHYQPEGSWENTENEKEALYIANLLRTLPKDKEVGIITFNVKQRDLLIDLIGEGNNTSSQKDSKWKDLTDSLRGSQEVHSRFDEFITKLYWLFREKNGKPRGTITEIDFQGFKGFRTDKELRGKRKWRVYGRCDYKFSRKKNQPESETGKISILINQLYLLDKLGMDKVASSYSETESWREQEFNDINFDSLINTIAHELAHAYQNTIHIRKPGDAIKSQCESSGKKDRKGNFLYPDKVVEHTQLTAEIEKMTIALSEYQEFKIWWTSKPPLGEEERCRDEKNNDSENESLSERKNCDYCGKIKSYNCCDRNFQEQNKSNNLFIKNLEEVQGDERDIIIFSIGYGPNEERKIRLNFGPLVNEGGEKRLNVAISRAREKIIIVTSLLPSDLSRITEEDENRKLGSKLFKKYLEYAYHCGKNEPEKSQSILEKSLPRITNTSLYQKPEEREGFGSLFEEQVYNELMKQDWGYKIDPQVKSIGYSIDLAVWDDKTQQYILGIECDGEYWHGKLENIERDIYRQQLLEKNGWKIIRILSRDWCRNKEREIERVKKQLAGS